MGCVNEQESPAIWGAFSLGPLPKAAFNFVLVKGHATFECISIDFHLIG